MERSVFKERGFEKRKHWRSNKICGEVSSSHGIVQSFAFSLSSFWKPVKRTLFASLSLIWFMAHDVYSPCENGYCLIKWKICVFVCFSFNFYDSFKISFICPAIKSVRLWKSALARTHAHSTINVMPYVLSESMTCDAYKPLYFSICVCNGWPIDPHRLFGCHNFESFELRLATHSTKAVPQCDLISIHDAYRNEENIMQNSAIKGQQYCARCRWL